ncbi:MAG: winged helix-turn-helix domain-containing protein [Desulfurococcaceae archaeon]|nr:winged helix-turn-helix domain-containing protein [Sulfolobales archaeon]MDW8170008.1 winged helix-turn-helix domain-containing protein [Desulfurococcaceae archaeon]
MSNDEIGGTSLRIYVHLLEGGEPMGVRDIAKALSMPASTVLYHLRRLEELGLVRRDLGGYSVSKVMSLNGFAIIGRRLVPRLIIYSVFFTGIAVGESLLIIIRGMNPDKLLAIVTSITASIIMLLEGLKARSKVILGSSYLKKRVKTSS